MSMQHDAEQSHALQHSSERADALQVDAALDLSHTQNIWAYHRNFTSLSDRHPIGPGNLEGMYRTALSSAGGCSSGPEPHADQRARYEQ